MLTTTPIIDKIIFAQFYQCRIDYRFVCTLYSTVHISTKYSSIKMAFAKPLMRGLLHKQIRLHLSIAIGLTVGAGIATRLLLGNQRKETYKNFYRDYDIDEVFNEIRQTGAFQSVPPE